VEVAGRERLVGLEQELAGQREYPDGMPEDTGEEEEDGFDDDDDDEANDTEVDGWSCSSPMAGPCKRL
jgi:hypothetical protein